MKASFTLSPPESALSATVLLLPLWKPHAIRESFPLCHKPQHHLEYLPPLLSAYPWSPPCFTNSGVNFPYLTYSPLFMGPLIFL